MSSFFMKSPHKLFFISFICIATGMMWYGIKHEWIIIQIPPAISFSLNQTNDRAVKLTYWHNEQWQTELQTFLCSDSPQNTLFTIVSGWLTHVHQEEILKKKVSLQSALIDCESQTAYLSFDRNPFDSAWSTHSKWMFIEGLLKTIRNTGISLQSIIFLVRHQPYRDAQLDFSHAWPLHGYTK